MNYIIAIIVVVVFFVAALIGLLSFRDRSITEENSTVNLVTLEEYANSDATVSFLDTGTIKGDEQYRSIRITVSRDSRIIEILAGYQYSPIETVSYTNTPEAYKTFLASIQVAGFVDEKKNPKIYNPAGRCPLGHRYFFSSTGIPNVPKDLWSASCSAGGFNGGSMGTFDGNFSTIKQLFQKQIPDYSKITSNVKL